MQVGGEEVQPLLEAVLRPDQGSSWGRQSHHRYSAHVLGHHLSDVEEQMDF